MNTKVYLTTPGHKFNLIREINKRTDLNNVTKLILWAIIDSYNIDNGKCFPSINFIASKVGCSVSWVKKNMKYVYNSGYLEVVKGRTGRANTYMIIYQTNYKVSVWVPHNINTHEGILNN